MSEVQVANGPEVAPGTTSLSSLMLERFIASTKAILSMAFFAIKLMFFNAKGLIFGFALKLNSPFLLNRVASGMFPYKSIPNTSLKKRKVT